MTLILDGHIHLEDGSPQTEVLLAEMGAAGVGGGLLISQRPASFQRAGAPGALTPAARLQHVLDWCTPGSNLYPLFWIDPLEPDALDQVAMAVAGGIAGFKVICNRFPPGHPAALGTFRAIAAARRPILFHSGILWDGKPSSEYCRPAGYEALLGVPGLRFALAHIGWPWCDELIAVYGKLLNALGDDRSEAVEMFVDITPGTPPIYRRRALTDLFTVGYDVADNVIFGSDCQAPGYNGPWVAEWLRRDEEILTSLGLGQNVLDKVRGDNLLRFLGLSDHRVERAVPRPGV
jgi:predicted TIM-barrel fold metal-dependent hydrolase